MTGVPLLEMRGITKRFPGVVANDDVTFTVDEGEIHTLLGENGAGKSTLMKILYGLYQPDGGEILLGGQPVPVTSPAEAIRLGIGMVHQHFMLVPTLTVAENIALGLPSTRGLRTDIAAVAARSRELGESYGLRVDVDAPVWQLSVGERQRVEILKALYRNARLLVLDEPTAVLTPGEVDQLFVLLRRMAADGKGLVFISHKLREVLALSDRITVLRDGRVSGHTTPAESSREDLARLMVGRPVQLAPDRAEVTVGPERLRITGLRVTGDRGTPAVDGVELSVRSGEILGIAGVSGNGQRELAEAVAGLRAVDAGEISIDGVALGSSPAANRAAGLAYVPEERMRDGAIGDFTVAENLVLVGFDRPPFCRRGLLRLDEIRRYGEELVERFSVRTPSTATRTSALSGGNIQKVVIARELAGGPTVLVAAQPTRGVDVGAAEYIHQQLMVERSQGTAIVVISEDLDEILGLADRIAVLFQGRVMGIVDREDATLEALGLMMTGEPQEG